MNDAVDVFQKARATNPEDNSTILNTAECLYFAKNVIGAKQLINEHKGLFESKDNGRLLDLFNIVELYFNTDKIQLLDIAKTYVDFETLTLTVKKISGWDLTEALHFIHFQHDSELKTIVQNIIWYWNGQITGENLLNALKLELPSKPKEN